MKGFMKLLCLGLLCLGMLIVAGCGGEEEADRSVAVSFANSSASWQKNGNTIKESLEKEGFTVDLQFADTADQQIEQIKEQIENEPKCLVIGAVDGEALTEVLEEAKEKNIPVIAYDRLIMNTDAVSYYASFDNESVGAAMGEYLEAALNLKQGQGPYNIEVFAGDPKDNNAHLFFSGAMDVLQPYIDKGQLIVPSGETSFEQAATDGWDAKNATTRMERILAAHPGVSYAAILSPNDGVAGGIREALAKGYTGAFPLLTGQDAEDSAITAIQNGQQAITIYKDPSQLTAKCVRMIKAVVEGTQPDINDVTTYNNGVKVVASYLCIPMIIDKDNTNLVK